MGKNPLNKWCNTSRIKIMQSDKEFLKELEDRNKPKKKKRFSFTNDYLIGDVGTLVEYFKKGDNE